MQDVLIVDLYWNRNEDAIQQTKIKYEAYLMKVAYNILDWFDIRRLTTHIFHERRLP